MPLTPIRVVLADMPRLHRELIRRILEEEPDIEVVFELTEDGLPFRRLIQSVEADVVIIGREARDRLADCRALLSEARPRHVIAVSADAREAHLYGIRSYEAAVDEFSPQFAVDVVREGDSPGERVET